MVHLLLTHPSLSPPPAVDHHGATLLWVVEMDSLAEVEDGGGIVRHPVVGPLEEVELLHLTHWHLGIALASKLGGGGGQGRIRGRGGGGGGGGGEREEGERGEERGRRERGGRERGGRGRRKGKKKVKEGKERKHAR